jgi:3-oxoacyl-[acyl-carrier-protein] synthase-3
VAAASRLFASGACRPNDVDFLLFCTQSPDYFLPTTACLVQERLGLRKDCGAIDFNQGCSGFVYGLALAKSMIEASVARNVLLITAETYSKFMHPRDRSLRTIFGDGAAATLVSAAESETESIGPLVFGTDGSGAANLIVPSGGLRRPATPETAVAREDEGGNWRSDQHLYMNGRICFTQSGAGRGERLLEGGAGRSSKVGLFVFHQANKFMLSRLREARAAGIKFWLDMENSATRSPPRSPSPSRRRRRLACCAAVTG